MGMGFSKFKELEELKLPYGLRIERDLHLGKSTVKDCI